MIPCYDTDVSKLLKPSSFMNYAQEAANLHASVLGFGYDDMMVKVGMGPLKNACEISQTSRLEGKGQDNDLAQRTGTPFLSQGFQTDGREGGNPCRRYDIMACGKYRYETYHEGGRA